MQALWILVSAAMLLQMAMTQQFINDDGGNAPQPFDDGPPPPISGDEPPPHNGDGPSTHYAPAPDTCDCGEPAGENGCGHYNKCGAHEYYGCVNRRASCSDTCDDRFKKSPECKKETLCPAMSCICEEGYARPSQYGSCAPIRDCPNKNCPENEFYSTCKSTCFTDSCDRKDLLLRQEYCDSYCDGEGGCTCQDDYARHPVSKKCVLKKDCPKGCASNEIYVDCKNTCLAETCEDFLNPPLHKKPCKNTCREGGCICKTGTYRNKNVMNLCTPVEQCTRTCDKDSISGGHSSIFGSSNGSGNTSSSGNGNIDTSVLITPDAGAAAVGVAPSVPAPGSAPPSASAPAGAAAPAVHPRKVKAPRHVDIGGS